MTGAKLQGASLIKVYLIKANCSQTDLTGAYLTGAYLTKTNFKEAIFNGAYLNGAKLTGAELGGAIYDKKTRFDTSFNPETVLMNMGDDEKASLNKSPKTLLVNNKQKNNIPTITIEQILEIFNHLTTVSRRYLGKTMTQKYWQSSRPVFEWLDNFEMTESTEIIFNCELDTVLSATKLQWLQAWVKTFIKNCSQIIQNYPTMLDVQLVKSLLSADFTEANQSEDLSSKKINSRELLSV